MIDVAGGDKIPRKGGPGITQSDLLVINKTDLAPHVGADLDVMERDAAACAATARRCSRRSTRRRRRPDHVDRARSTRGGGADGRPVIKHHAYDVEPWTVRERALPTDLLAASESIFALANGHIGLRGNLDEGEPYGVPGSYLNGFYELHPLPYAEAGYGFPESGQTIINVTNGKPIRLLVDDEPFDVRYGDLRSHERVLDLRDGVLRREVEWYSPAGDGVRVSSVRLVSFSQRAIAAILYEVEPIDDGVRVVAQSELVANEPVPAPIDMDPRAGALLIEPLRSEWHATRRASRNPRPLDQVERAAHGRRDGPRHRGSRRARLQLGVER